MTPPLMEGVASVLAKSRALGFLGPGEVGPQISHAAAFATAAESALPHPPAHVVDLGSGGGIPGLVLAALWPTATFLLVDGSTRRCDFLEEAVAELDIAEHVAVRCGRAEDLAHEDSLRGAADLVVARSFGPPAVLAECAAGLLEVGGSLLVSEPPEEDGRRWPTDGLEVLGFGPARIVVAGARFAVIPLAQPCPDRFPRRVGVPTKRPLF